MSKRNKSKQKNITFSVCWLQNHLLSFLIVVPTPTYHMEQNPIWEA